jgi:predicted aspartyl protease
MRTKTWPQVAAGCVIVATVLVEARERNSVALQSRDDSLVIVEGSVGELDHLTFVLDTGSHRTAIDDEVARRLKVVGAPDEVESFGARAAAERVEVPPIRIGPMRVANLKVLAMDLDGLARVVGVRPDAIVGLDVLLGSCFTVDYRTRTLTFERAAEWDFSIPLDARRRYPIVEVLIDGATYRLLVDTGSEQIVIFENAMPLRNGIAAAAETRADHINGTTFFRQFTAASVRLPNLELRGLPVFVSPAGEERGYDGLFGPRSLRSRRLQFDLERMVLSWQKSVELR